jgi:hypothetical protein
MEYIVRISIKEKLNMGNVEILLYKTIFLAISGIICIKFLYKI